MGFLKQAAAKLTGADVAGDAAERGAMEQANATREAAARAAASAQEAAAQTGRQQEANAARAAAEGAASDALAKPVENPDVQLAPSSGESVSAQAKKRRQTFGVGSAGTGVNI